MACGRVARSAEASGVGMNEKVFFAAVPSVSASKRATLIALQQEALDNA